MFFEEIHPISIKQPIVDKDGKATKYEYIPVGTAIEYTNGMYHVEIKNGPNEIVQNRAAVNRLAEFYTARVLWKSKNIMGELK